MRAEDMAVETVAEALPAVTRAPATGRLWTTCSVITEVGEGMGRGGRSDSGCHLQHTEGSPLAWHWPGCACLGAAACTS